MGPFTVPDLAYADDIALFGDSFEDAQAVLERVEHYAAALGVRINAAKTRFLYILVFVPQQRHPSSMESH